MGSPSRVFLPLLLGSIQLAAAAPLDFNLEVRPILSDRCFRCHGFDGKAREADLRLDTPEGAFAKRESGQAVVPGDPAKSLLWQRITSSDPGDVMPPPDSHLKLNDGEKEILRQWIAEGAVYQKHWALIPVGRPSVPKPATEATIRNPIDAFVVKGLLERNLTQAPEAPRRALIRRLSLDLRGLPPTPEEVDAFLRDESPDAYQQLVDRMLASPSFGERMAWPWLDAARYADSNGYQGDRERTMWPWRDWVVDAFNRNVPWDDLTVWQLAGDLLPDATEEQKLATAFLRNHPINGEGGRIPEENRVDYVMDMAETTGTVWLGLTFNCCRCHDHKYDSLTQEEYYQLNAFFNQTPVNGGGGDPQTPPVLAISSGEQKARGEDLAKEVASLRSELDSLQARLAPEQQKWEAALREKDDRAAWMLLQLESANAASQTLKMQKDRTILASGDNPDNDTYTITGTTWLDSITGIRLEAIRHKSMTKGGLARSDSGNFVLTEFEVRIKADPSAETESLPIKSASASYEQGSHKITGTYDGKPDTGWAVYENRPVDRDHQAVFRFDHPAPIPRQATIEITLRHDSPHAKHNLGNFRLWVTNAPDPQLPGANANLHEALRVPSAERTKEQHTQIETAFRQTRPEYADLLGRITGAEKKLTEHRQRYPKVMVMQDQEQLRKTYILAVGAYDKHEKEVTAGTPASLPPMPEDYPRNRLGLARWLVAENNPLTARVTVNRFWQELFGVGLIKSPENFGVQSEFPLHPQLLDWLAAEFMATGWDVKHLLRTIVTSHTYRQSSRVSPELLEADPANRLLTRGARYRMPAWMIRDQALAASGLLVEKRGGNPVNSYQPAGIWAEATFGKKKYTPGKGDDLHRRSLYSFWRRIAAPPMFFDNPSREVCSVKPGRTNTPLHALSTLNDTTYVEAARALAARAAKESGAAAPDRLQRAFQLVLARPPHEKELAILEESFDRALIRYTADPEAARNFLANGDSPRDSDLPEAEHAALATVCLGILNLDEALTRE